MYVISMFIGMGNTTLYKVEYKAFIYSMEKIRKLFVLPAPSPEGEDGKIFNTG
jgi:hypothetical protein